jgi:16S rRNA (cytosine1402-N4)-methyltransferase
MAPGARMAVITFHSLEDRIVKVFLRTHSQEWLDRPEWPEPRPNGYPWACCPRRPTTPGPTSSSRVVRTTCRPPAAS